MAILTLRLPVVKAMCDGRPGSCVHCGAQTLQSWGGRMREVRDPQVKVAVVRRYRCTACGRTFRHYPAGITRAQQSDRLVVLAAMLWALGSSLRSATAILGAFGLTLCHQTVWRDGIAFGKQLKLRRLRGKVPVLGVDGTGVKLRGDGRGIMVAVDMGTGAPVTLGLVDEKDPDALLRWLAPIIERHGVEVLVTDDLAVYGPVAKAAHVDRQRCIFHLKRWVGRALRGYRQKLPQALHPWIDEVDRLVDQRPPDGGYRLFQIYEHLPVAPMPPPDQPPSPLYTFRQMVLRLSNHWQEYLLYQRRPDVPTTNNASEVDIGRLKLRLASMRGIKTSTGLEAVFHLGHAGLLA